MHLAGGRSSTGSARSARCGTRPCRARSQQSLPTTNPCSSAGLPADSSRIMSLHQFCQPNTKFSPPLCSVFCSTSGLVAAKLEGAIMSSTCRTENSTTASFAGDTPRTPVVALCHHCSLSRKAWASRLNGGLSHSGCGESPVLGLRLDQGPGLLRRHAARLRISWPRSACRPWRSPFAAAAPPPDATPNRYRPAKARPAICRRSAAPPSREARGRPDTAPAAATGVGRTRPARPPGVLRRNRGHARDTAASGSQPSAGSMSTPWNRSPSSYAG